MIEAPENVEFQLTVEQTKPWRQSVTLTEFEIVKRRKVSTGRSWSEPYDPINGDPEELEERFRRQIFAPTEEEIPESISGTQQTLEICFCLQCIDIPIRRFRLIKRFKQWRKNREVSNA